MTAKRRVVECANPLCNERIPANEPGALELSQVQPAGEPPTRWALCGISCARAFLILSALHNRATALEHELEASR